MNKIVLTKTNAIFLAAILVAGTIALSSPSFMTGAEAYPYNNYDNDHEDKFKLKPSYGKSSVQYNKCVNVNLNFPGLDFSPSFGAEVASLGVESLARDGGNNGPGPNNGGNNGPNGFKSFEKDGVVSICINANDNSVRGGIDRGEEEPDLACEECFAANSRLQTALLDFLAEWDFGALTFGAQVEEGQGDGFVIGPQTDTIEQFCAQIENASEELGIPLSDFLLEFVLSIILGDEFESEIDALIDCLLEAGLIIHVERPDFTSANGIANLNVECTGDPLCTKLEQQ